MLKACVALHVGFRPHVKTHKVGDRTKDVKIIVSTVAEAEHLSDFLSTCRENQRSVNILYGVPLPPSRIERLAHLGKKLGSESISVLVDNECQLQAARAFKDMAGFQLKVFVKVDTGYHRAGVVVGTEKFNRLITDILDEECRGTVEFLGFYSHAGHSYGGDSALGAMELLIVELEGLEKAAAHASTARGHAPTRPKYLLSVGATPTATSIENMLEGSAQAESPMGGEIAKLKTVIDRINATHAIEIHAGVYPFLDMQQLATQASPSALPAHPNHDTSGLSTADIALTIMAEVASVYESRDSPEALVAAGSLALGRDPCKSYDGWGIVSDWGMLTDNPEGRSGWQVGRISQEHGILTKDSQHESHELAELKIGQRVRVWPNHACVAGAGFGWYLVVDSSLADERRDEIVDVWVRCRGW
ncbi:MAG: hypothetical protein ASARMPREDX12_006207 [Alectoria sarmentosa]|nr:MAG: hypothetical protein ASARMPREDX12_006207 [Alectoria sarmentosa]